MTKSDDELNVSKSWNEGFKTILQSFQQLNADQAYEYSELYIKMCRKNPLSYVTLDQNIEIFKTIGKPMNSQATIHLDDTGDWDVKEIEKPINTPNDNSNSNEDLNVEEIGTQSNTPATAELQVNCDLDVKKIDVPINNTPATMEQDDNNCESDAESIKAAGVHKTMEFQLKIPDTKQFAQIKRAREKDDDQLNNNSPIENTVDNETEQKMRKKPKLLSNMNL